MNIILTPKVGTSDMEVKLSTAWKDGVTVSRGEVFCEVETSKTTYDVESEFEGHIYMLHEVGDRVKVGDPLALVSEKPLDPSKLTELKGRYAPQRDASTSNVKSVTRKARELMEANGIDESEFDLELVTEKDVVFHIQKRNVLSKLSDMTFGENDVVIVGIRGHASMCIDLVNKYTDLKIVGFLSDIEYYDEKYQIDYLGPISTIEILSSQGLTKAILGIGYVGDLRGRQRMYYFLKRFVELPTIIHGSAIVEPTAKIGNGTQIMAGSIVGSNAVIGENCIVNSGAIVSHDCVIGSSSHITPGATLGGSVNVGERVTVGMCVSIYFGVNISNDRTILNGTNVFEDL